MSVQRNEMVRSYGPPMRRTVTGAIATLVVVAGLAVAPAAMAAPGNDRATEVAEHWTPQRLAAAEPRDLLIDERGLGYERRANGRLEPHGHRVPATSSAPVPRARPSGGDTVGPTVTDLSPAAGAIIGAAHTLSASVSDPSVVSSVSFVLTGPDRQTATYAATGSGSVWTAPVGNLALGKWSWTVRAVDGRGNVRTTSKVGFSVSATPPSDSPITANAAWSGGDVQRAAGRIYFEMPDASGESVGYVCSGTVVTDPSENDRSVILTAAHCVYDDVAKVFAKNVMFIPNQAASGTRTDVDCSNDRFGCWVPSHGVVDRNWTAHVFPDNIPWDYAYYVVPTDGAHTQGTTTTTTDSLEQEVGALDVQYTAPRFSLANSPLDRTTALGYSYSNDPYFMYCAEDMKTNGTANWWLPNCGLSGGSSGGPWVQPFDTETGSGLVISVNSWGYTSGPGMAGPKLSGTSAETLFTDSLSDSLSDSAISDVGVILVD